MVRSESRFEGAVLVAGLAVFHERAVKVPGDLKFTHPERLDPNLVLWALVWLASRFGIGCAEGELTSRDGDEIECGVLREFYFFHVALHRGKLRVGRFHDRFMDGSGGREKLGIRRLRHGVRS